MTISTGETWERVVVKRDLLFAGLIWVALSAVGAFLASRVNLYPFAAAEEGQLIDEAFRLLLVLAAPVAAFVLTGLGYSLLRFRSRPGRDDDGKPARTNRAVAIAWLAVTTALAVYIAINPGLIGLRELGKNPNADLVIRIEGEQWHWNVAYPQHGVEYERALQLAVPVGTRVKFEVTSKDVIHSFWIPAFRLKVDALPGQVTEMYVTPTQTGSFDEDTNFRVQCAELCGTGHARMKMSLLVLEPEAFDRWIAEAKGMTGSGTNGSMPGMPMPTEEKEP